MKHEPINESEEMYLKTLLTHQSTDRELPVRTTDVAKALEVSPASVTEMIQRLASKGYVDYVPYKGSTLTVEGLAIASKIKRRESLMELFLIRLIGYKGDVKEAACKLEHALTEELEVAIDRLLGFPQFDHSGDEIPHVFRELDFMGRNQLLPLSVLSSGDSAQIELMILSGQELRTVGELGLDIGTKIVCTGDVFTVGEKTLKLSAETASRIVIRKIS